MIPQQTKALIGAIAAGNISQLQNVTKERICFIELSTRDNATYSDKAGKTYTEAEKETLCTEAAKQFEIVFTEIKTYE